MICDKWLHIYGNKLGTGVNCEWVDAVNVVELVRCKDCRHKPNGYIDDDVLRYPNFPHEENNPCPCHVYEDEWYSWIPNDDFYCGFGERKEE